MIKVCLIVWKAINQDVTVKEQKDPFQTKVIVQMNTDEVDISTWLAVNDVNKWSWLSTESEAF